MQFFGDNVGGMGVDTYSPTRGVSRSRWNDNHVISFPSDTLELDTTRCSIRCLVVMVYLAWFGSRENQRMDNHLS